MSDLVDFSHRQGQLGYSSAFKLISVNSNPEPINRGREAKAVVDVDVKVAVTEDYNRAMQKNNAIATAEDDRMAAEQVMLPKKLGAVDEKMIYFLLDLGFSNEQCIRALRAVNNRSVEEAVEYIVTHDQQQSTPVPAVVLAVTPQYMTKPVVSTSTARAPLVISAPPVYFVYNKTHCNTCGTILNTFAAFAKHSPNHQYTCGGCSYKFCFQDRHRTDCGCCSFCRKRYTTKEISAPGFWHYHSRSGDCLPAVGDEIKQKPVAIASLLQGGVDEVKDSWSIVRGGGGGGGLSSSKSNKDEKLQVEYGKLIEQPGQSKKAGGGAAVQPSIETLIDELVSYMDGHSICLKASPGPDLAKFYRVCEHLNSKDKRESLQWKPKLAVIRSNGRLAFDKTGDFLKYIGPSSRNGGDGGGVVITSGGGGGQKHAPGSFSQAFPPPHMIEKLVAAKTVTVMPAANFNANIRAATNEANSFECPYCFCVWPRDEEVICSRSDKPHTICKSCFCNMVGVQSNNITEFTNNGGAIVCLSCLGDKPKVSTPYAESTICLHISKDPASFVSYMSAIRAAERFQTESQAKANMLEMDERMKEMILESEIRVHKDDEKEMLVAVANLHRHRIIDTILTTKCPHCSLVFIDWTNCFAVKCEAEVSKDEYRGCRKYFCGWCLKAFKEGCACHDHVAACEKSPNKGTCYAKDTKDPRKEFNTAQAPVRKQKILAYMDANKMSAIERKALLTLMQKTDLDALGIRL